MLNAAMNERQPSTREVRAHSHRPMGEPKTPGDRMTMLRKRLGLRQEDVAAEIKFVRRDGLQSTMSRSAYCMYEADSVTMDIDRVSLIAKVLKTTPEYLAYGVSDENAISEVELSHGMFVPVRKWALNDDWLYAKYEAEASEIALIQLNGDIVVTRVGAKPSARGAEFVFALDGKVRLAHIEKPGRASKYLVTEGRAHRELDEADIVVLGKVIGKFA